MTSIVDNETVCCTISPMQCSSMLYIILKIAPHKKTKQIAALQILYSAAVSFVTVQSYKRLNIIKMFKGVIWSQNSSK